MSAAVSPFLPKSLGSNDLNSVIRTDFMCSVKCAEATWNSNDSQGGRVHYKLTAFFFLAAVQARLRISFS